MYYMQSRWKTSININRDLDGVRDCSSSCFQNVFLLEIHENNILYIYF